MISAEIGEDLEEPSSDFMRDVVFGRNENLYNITRATVGLGYLGLELTLSISRRISSWWKAKQAAGESLKRVEEVIEATGRAAGESLKPLEESIEATERAAGEAIEESADIQLFEEEAETVVESELKQVTDSLDASNLIPDNSKLQKIIDMIRQGKKFPNGRRIVYQQDERTKIIFGLDLGENAHPLKNQGYIDPVEHMNIEIQQISASGKTYTKWDMHLILDDNKNVIDTVITGPWKDK